MEKLGAGDPLRIGAYRLLARLGAGGMGRVYLARSDRGRTVAVKLVREELAAQEEFRARFRQEVRAAREVGGYWTAPVLDADTEAAVPWVATGYVAGPSLQRVVGRDHGPLAERSVRILAAGLAHALTDIHAAGIVHRDLKPSNVLVTIDGPRVIDFGIARALETLAGDGLTRTGSLVGSPGFMAPEQVRGDRITPACDVFCLGSVLAYAATGRLPFGGASTGAHAQMFRIVQEEPDLADVPEGVADLVRACLRKDPATRPTVRDVLAWTDAGDTLSGGRSRDPWLPAALVAQLARHAVQLLDTEDPETASTPTPPSAGHTPTPPRTATEPGGTTARPVPGPVPGAGSSPVSGAGPNVVPEAGAAAASAAGGAGAAGGVVPAGAQGEAPGGGAVPPPPGAVRTALPDGTSGAGPAEDAAAASARASAGASAEASTVPGAGAAVGTPTGAGAGAGAGGGPGAGAGVVPAADVVSDAPGPTLVQGAAGDTVPGPATTPLPGREAAGNGPAEKHGGSGPAEEPGGSGPAEKPGGSGPAEKPAGAAEPVEKPGGAGQAGRPAGSVSDGRPGQIPVAGDSGGSGDVSVPPPPGDPRAPGGGHLPTVIVHGGTPPPAAPPVPGHPRQAAASAPYAHPQPAPGYGYPPQQGGGAWAGAGHPMAPTPYPGGPGGPGPTPPYGPAPVGVGPAYGIGGVPPREPERSSARSTALLVVIALVVALVTAGSVYALMDGGGDTGGDGDGKAGGVTTSPTTGADRSVPPTTAGPSPSDSTTSKAPQDGTVPAGYLGTWEASIDNASGHSTRELTISQGEVGDTVLRLVADGPSEGGGGYHCVFTAELAQEPGAGAPLEIGPSTVTTGQPRSSCSPGEATQVTLLSDGRLRREKPGSGESLTYTRHTG